MSYNNGIEKVTKTYTVHTIREYNNLIALMKEHHLPILQIQTTTGDADDCEVYKVTTEGEDCYLKFVEFLLKKEQEKIEQVLSKIGIKTNEAL